jgi:hypothetical protein
MKKKKKTILEKKSKKNKNENKWKKTCGES